MFDVITIGGATRDVFFSTDEARVLEGTTGKVLKKYLSFEYGSKIIPNDTEFAYGGGGANTAISFAKLGLKTASILRIGLEGTGSLILKELEEAGVDCRYVHRDHVNHTALSVVVSLPGKDHTMFLYRGSNNFLTVPDWRQMKTKWFYLSSLTGESADLIPELFAYARAHGIKVAWNPGSEQIKSGYDDISSFLELTDTLILNREEAISLVLSKNNRVKISDEKAILAALYEMTNGVVVMTDGGDGSYVSDGNKDYFESSIATEVVETTGSGDAYGSTFVAARILGYSVKGAMKMASGNAANVIRFIGAQKGLMTISELRATIDIGGIDEITNLSR